MLEKLGFRQPVEETLTVKRQTRAMPMHRFVLAMVLACYVGFSRLYLKCAQIRSERHASPFSSQYSWCNPPRTGFARTKCRLGRQWRLPDGGGGGMIGAGIPGPRL
jgi:hypothetical protein